HGVARGVNPWRGRRRPARWVVHRAPPCPPGVDTPGYTMTPYGLKTARRLPPGDTHRLTPARPRPSGRCAGAAHSRAPQLAPPAVPEDPVGDAQPNDVPPAQARLVGRLQHGAAEAAHQLALLYRHHQRQLLDRLEVRLLVQRLGEPGVDDADVDALL